MSGNNFDPRILKQPLIQEQPKQMIISAWPLSPRATLAGQIVSAQAIACAKLSREDTAAMIRSAFDAADLILSIEKEAGDRKAMEANEHLTGGLGGSA